MASVDLGMLNWDKQNTTTSFRFVTNGGAIQSKSYAASVTPDAICSQYKQSTADKTWQAAEIGFSIGGAVGNTYVIVYDPTYSDAATFKTAMSGVQLVYELATPLEYTLTAQQLTTLLGENNIFADCGPILNCEYRADTGLYANGKLVEIETLRATIAPIEDGDTASQAYAQGKYFFHNGDFCKALTAIASGATFTLNTNYSVTTVAAELFTALNS